MNYVNFMRKVEGKPPKVEPEFDTSGFSYTGSMRVRVNLVRDVLDGEYSVIQDAFTWRGTSIENDWFNVFVGDNLTPTQEEYLEWLIEEYN